jgi:hypothetical protein
MRIKNCGGLMYNLVLPSIFLFFCGKPSFGQETINFSVGFGLPEGINAGIHFQPKQSQIRFGFGTMPLKDESFISLSSDFYYHFAGSSEFSSRRPWYGRIGLMYLRDETTYVIDKSLFLNPRIGRDFNISEKIGIEFDAGLIFRLFHEEIDKEPSNALFISLDFPILPGFGISIFYRI